MSLLRNKPLRLLVASLILTSQFSSPFWIAVAHAQSSGVVTKAPDDVDYATYHSYYQSALSSSNSARATSDATQIRAEGIDDSIDTKSLLFQQKDTTVAKNESEIKSLKDSNASLKLRTDDLRRQVQVLDGQISTQTGVVKSHTDVANALYQVKVTAESEFTKADASFKREAEILALVQGQFDRAHYRLGEIANAKISMKNASDDINRRLPGVQRMHDFKSHELNNLNQKTGPYQVDVANQTANKKSADDRLKVASDKDTADKAALRNSEAAMRTAEAAKSRAEGAVNAKQTEITTLTAKKDKALADAVAAKTEADRIRDTDLKIAKFDRSEAKQAHDKAVADMAPANVIQEKLAALNAANQKVADTESRMNAKLAEVTTQNTLAQTTAVQIEEKKTEKAPLDAALVTAVTAHNASVTAKNQAVDTAKQCSDALVVGQTAVGQSAASLKQAQDRQAQHLALVGRTQAELQSLDGQIRGMIRDLGEIQRTWKHLDVEEEEQSINRRRAELEIQRQTPYRDGAWNARIKAESDQTSARARYLEAYQAFDAQNNILIGLNNRRSPLASELSQKDTQQSNQLTRIGTLDSENTNLRRDSASLKNEVAGLKKDSQAAWILYQAQNTEATRLEAITATKLADYNMRADKYRTELAKAQAYGSSQGVLNGNVDALVAAKTDGEKVGSTEGEIVGRRQGLEYGYKEGQNVGDQEGEAAGKKYGLELPSNTEEGYKQGLSDGRENARADAERIDYPAGRRDYRAERLNTEPSKTVELVAGQVLPGPIGGFAPTRDSIERERGVRDSSFAVDPRSLPSVINNDLSVGIAKATDSQNDPKFKEYLKTYKVDLSKVDCVNNSYQSYEVLVKACYDSYDVSYRGKYEAVYKSEYPTHKSLAFEKSRSEAFNANKMVRFQEGHDLAYGPAYQRGVAIGASEAKADGYKIGKSEGYSEQFGDAQNPGPARKEAYAKGREEEKSYFATNPVVRLLGVDAVRVNRPSEKPGFLPGDEIELRAKTANYGDVAAPAGSVKLKWQALTQNVVAEEGYKDLPGVPANVNANVKGLSRAKVDRRAGGFENFSLRITAQLPTGESQSMDLPLQTAELFIFADFPELKYSESVQAATSTPRGETYNSYTVKATVANSGKYRAELPFRVVFSTDAPAGLVIKSPETMTKLLGAGESQKLELKYTFAKGYGPLRGKLVPLKITVYYGERIAAETVATIKPW